MLPDNEIVEEQIDELTKAKRKLVGGILLIVSLVVIVMCSAYLVFNW